MDRGRVRRVRAGPRAMGRALGLALPLGVHWVEPVDVQTSRFRSRVGFNRSGPDAPRDAGAHPFVSGGIKTVVNLRGPEPPGGLGTATKVAATLSAGRDPGGYPRSHHGVWMSPNPV